MKLPRLVVGAGFGGSAAATVLVRPPVDDPIVDRRCETPIPTSTRWSQSSSSPPTPRGRSSILGCLCSVAVLVGAGEPCGRLERKPEPFRLFDDALEQAVIGVTE
jgi:hypothetical protein